jgi:hypothetical protein
MCKTAFLGSTWLEQIEEEGYKNGEKTTVNESTEITSTSVISWLYK